MLRAVSVELERRRVRDFLRLPKKLYSRSTNMESPEEVKKLLLGIHPLSGYFRLTAFLIYNGKEAVGRFCIVRYPEDALAYLGFFECVNSTAVARFLFENVRRFAKKMNCESVIGPVNASFWLGYRLKINGFERTPYTGEPYNREYYYELFLENGYRVKEHYVSNGYPADIPADKEKCERRLELFLERGYDIVSPERKDFDSALETLYGLITSLYRDFPVYKEISFADFRTLFDGYRHILNMEMVKIAYYQGEAVGFLVGVPDYGNRVYHTGDPRNLLRILCLRRKPKAYVLLYLGAAPEHPGLGSAIAGCIWRQLREKRLSSIAALARDGKVTQNYARSRIVRRYEYVLLERRL